MSRHISAADRQRKLGASVDPMRPKFGAFITRGGRVAFSIGVQTFELHSVLDHTDDPAELEESLVFSRAMIEIALCNLAGVLPAPLAMLANRGLAREQNPQPDLPERAT